MKEARISHSPNFLKQPSEDSGILKQPSEDSGIHAQTSGATRACYLSSIVIDGGDMLHRAIRTIFMHSEGVARVKPL